MLMEILLTIIFLFIVALTMIALLRDDALDAEIDAELDAIKNERWEQWDEMQSNDKC